MKALSIRQPWAWLIAHGHKPVENRTWPTAYRGDLLIHASKVFDAEGLASVVANFPHLKPALPQQYELGGVVGCAQLLNCVSTHPSAWFTGPYGFVIYSPRAIGFVPAKGALGFFDLAISEALHSSLHAGSPQQAEAAGQDRLFG